jgi:hypothetical protein
MKNNRNTVEIYKARTIGTFFLLAFLAYGIGRSLFESEIYYEKYIGTFLLLTNSLMVFLIGLLLKKTLQKFNVLISNLYFFTRLFESLALASIVLNLIPNIHISYDHGYFIAMLILGIGSIPMCFSLYRHKLVPTWLALWGIVGYSIFSFGFLMEFFGREWSMYLLGMGGLWEIFFAIWLIIKGKKV